MGSALTTSKNLGRFIVAFVSFKNIEIQQKRNGISAKTKTKIISFPVEVAAKRNFLILCDVQDNIKNKRK